jgi:hypothetical protein
LKRPAWAFAGGKRGGFSNEPGGLDRKSDQEIIMVSNSAGGITTEEAEVLVKDLKKRMIVPRVQLYPGVAYRHLLVWDGGPKMPVPFRPMTFRTRTWRPI